jgi:UDPglucose 6-dehydrogenase
MEKIFFGSEVIQDIEKFKIKSDIIVSNRISEQLLDVQGKIFSRDIFKEN